jgi:hypothetical protein
MYPVLKITHVLDFLDTSSMGVTPSLIETEIFRDSFINSVSKVGLGEEKKSIFVASIIPWQQRQIINSVSNLIIFQKKKYWI